MFENSRSEFVDQCDIMFFDLTGLNAFSTDYPEATCLLLYRGNERLKKGNTLCLPIEPFLKALTPLSSTLPE